MKRLFVPGEEWLYIRLFMGPEISDYWLSTILPRLLSVMENRKLIKQYFFIRYIDPSFHIRLRFRLHNIDDFGEVVKSVKQLSADLIDSELLWNIELGSYDRELERFGKDWIENAEKIFDIDSKYWEKILPAIREHHDGENLRWKAALLSAHFYFNSFILDSNSRIDLIKRMVDTLEKEMQGGRRLSLQIDEKFRKHRQELEKIILNPDEIQLPGLSIALQNRSESIMEMAFFKENIESWELKKMQARVSDLIHLSLNRGFRSKHRMHELVIYSFLKELYISFSARRDTNPS